MKPAWTEVVLEDLLEPAPRTPAPLRGVRVGTVTVADAIAGVWVSFDEQPSPEAIQASTTVVVSPEDEGRRVLLVFENGDPARPIITGFIQEQPVSPPATMMLDRDAVDEIQADEAQVCIEAHKEMVLRCGRSSITLRADGKIIIKGREIVSRAQQTNKIKGGTVRIN